MSIEIGKRIIKKYPIYISDKKYTVFIEDPREPGRDVIRIVEYKISFHEGECSIDDYLSKVNGYVSTRLDPRDFYGNLIEIVKNAIKICFYSPSASDILKEFEEWDGR